MSFELETVGSNKVHSIVVVPPIALDAYWPQVKQLLENSPEAWEYGHTVDSIRSLIEAGELALWLVLAENKIAMAALTEWEFYPKLRVLRLVWGAGSKIDEFLPLALGALETAVQRSGGGAVIVSGREGFKRKFAQFGFELLNVSLIKTVSAERVH